MIIKGFYKSTYVHDKDLDYSRNLHMSKELYRNGSHSHQTRCEWLYMRSLDNHNVTNSEERGIQLGNTR